MSDAVALFRPSNPDALLPFLDLDDESEESEGIYAEALEDGASFLLHTFQPYQLFAENPDEARAWFAQFGEALAEVHDDARGVLFFPDTVEPEAQSYDGVVAEVGEQGVFVSLLAGIDMEALQAIATQLLGGAGPDGSPQGASSFEIAKMMEGVHDQLLATFGLDAREGKPGENAEPSPSSDAPLPGAEKPKP